MILSGLKARNGRGFPSKTNHLRFPKRMQDFSHIFTHVSSNHDPHAQRCCRFQGVWWAGAALSMVETATWLQDAATNPYWKSVCRHEPGIHNGNYMQLWIIMFIERFLLTGLLLSIGVPHFWIAWIVFRPISALWSCQPDCTSCRVGGVKTRCWELQKESFKLFLVWSNDLPSQYIYMTH